MTKQPTALEALENAVMGGGRVNIYDQYKGIAAIIGGGATFSDWGMLNKILENGDMNAAIALAEGVLPNHGWGIGQASDATAIAVMFDPENGDEMDEHENEIPARALLLAIIAAKKLELQNG